MDLLIRVETAGSNKVVYMEGELDVYTAPKFREQILGLISAGSYHLVMDLEKVDFLDSAGLDALVEMLKRVRAHNGYLVLVCTQERILKIFRITGLTKVFGIYASLDEVLATKP
jgi:anti-sigma B factor antagonist